MKARILNDNFYGGTYTDEWLTKYQLEIVNGQLVSEWALTDVLPASNLIRPIWNVSLWEEGATQQQQDDYNTAQEEQEDKEQNLIEEKDALEYISAYKQRLRRRVKKGQLTKNQAKRIRYDLKEVWLMMLIGFWDVAKDILTQFPDYTNAKLQTELEFLRTRIKNYQEQRRNYNK